MNRRPVYLGLFIAGMFCICEHRNVCEPVCGNTRFANQQVLLKLTKLDATGYPGVIRQILPWRIQIESLSSDDPDGPYLISLPKEISPEQAISKASSDNRVEYVEPNYPIYAADTIPNDPFFEFMWQLKTRP